MKEIEIPLSRTKILLLLTGALVFVVLGIWGAIDPERFVSIRYPKDVVFHSAIAAVLFFGLCAVFIAKKAFSRKPGLIINDQGIFDNSNATSIGLIEWKDITGMQTIEIASSKVLVIQTSNPEKYIARAGNIISRKAMIANNLRYGSPISIISNSLKIKYTELENLIAEQIEKRTK